MGSETEKRKRWVKMSNRKKERKKERKVRVCLPWEWKRKRKKHNSNHLWADKKITYKERPNEKQSN